MNAHEAARPDRDAITPLEGEAGIPDVARPQVSTISWKGLAAVTLLVVSLVAVSAMAIHRMLFAGPKDPESGPKRTSDRPIAAAAEPRKLDMASAPAVKPSAPAGLLIPALEPSPDDEVAAPIGVHRTGTPAAHGGRGTRVAPEDAPVMLVTSRRSLASNDAVAVAAHAQPGHATPNGMDQQLAGTQRNLEAYQRQLQGLLDSLTKTANLASGTAGRSAPALDLGLGLGQALSPGSSAAPGQGSGVGLFGGQLQGSGTPRVSASRLGNRSLTLPKGTAFTCALKTKVISAVSGLVGCQVQRNVYSDDGRVLLIERGSHMDGEYRIAAVRPGTVRIPVLWTRIRTPLGVTVDIESPGTGPLGESGIDGYVDNRWMERIGAAMLVSLIDDAVEITLRSEAGDSGADTILMPSTTSNASKLAEKVLDSTINIPPLIYQNQGGIVGIYAARDVDFSTVYELQLAPPRTHSEAGP
jgi:type IV secretion system protein VirB10